jgi:hypothetical protein
LRDLLIFGFSEFYAIILYEENERMMKMIEILRNNEGFFALGGIKKNLLHTFG